MVLNSRRPLRAAVVATLVLVANACAGGDERTEKVLPGMSRDSVLNTLASEMGGTPGTPAADGDSLKNVWRKTQYLMNGVNIEVIWYSPSGEKWTAADTVPKERVIPVVLLDGKVAGVGRSAYSRVAEQYKLPPNKY